MRLDHLLSKERSGQKKFTELRVSKGRAFQEALFSFEDAEAANGGVAQLGEHLPCTQRVRSSILLISTTRSREGVVRVTSEQTKKHGRIAQVVRAHA